MKGGYFMNSIPLSWIRQAHHDTIVFIMSLRLLFRQNDDLIVLHFHYAAGNIKILRLLRFINDLDLAFFQDCNDGGVIIQDFERTIFPGKLHEGCFA
jgi:hypothetical protein